MPFLVEAGLLERFRAGDRAALGSVYDHYSDGLARGVRMGFRVQTDQGPAFIPPVTSTFEVESLCHEVFIKAFAEPARRAYDGQRPYLTWLLRIARNLRIDQHRRDRRLVFTDAPPEVELEGGLEEGLLDRELVGIVETFVQGLGEPDQSYYQARYRVGGSQTDAAAACGLTRIQGRRIEARIKRTLVGHLAAHGHSPRSGGGDDEL